MQSIRTSVNPVRPGKTSQRRSTRPSRKQTILKLQLLMQLPSASSALNRAFVHVRKCIRTVRTPDGIWGFQAATAKGARFGSFSD